jgi:GNAT superfamily N-acetyltransferase
LASGGDGFVDGSWQSSARDKVGDPLLLVADLNADTLVVRAFRDKRKGHEAVLISSIAGETATIRNIGGFRADSVGHGVGTALLQFAEEVLAGQGVRVVTGRLAEGDLGHRDRQIRFCVKNGYQVRLTGQTGRVSKSLASSPWVRNDFPGRR